MLKRKWKRPLKISFSPRNSLKSKHCHPSMSQILFMILLFITHYNHTPCSSSLFLVTANDSSLPSSTTANTASSKLYSKDTPLNIHEIAELRVRDIKRRLSRQHGYSLTEISKMMDKKELIEALAFEEHKAQMLIDQNNKRRRTKYSIIVALLAVIVVMFWPLFKHVYEVVSVNVVVYTGKIAKSICSLFIMHYISILCEYYFMLTCTYFLLPSNDIPNFEYMQNLFIFLAKIRKSTNSRGVIHIDLF